MAEYLRSKQLSAKSVASRTEADSTRGGRSSTAAAHVLLLLGDAPRFAYLRKDLTVEVLGPLCSDRVMRRPANPGAAGHLRD